MRAKGEKRPADVIGIDEGHRTEARAAGYVLAKLALC